MFRFSNSVGASSHSMEVSSPEYVANTKQTTEFQNCVYMCVFVCVRARFCFVLVFFIELFLFCFDFCGICF